MLTALLAHALSLLPVVSQLRQRCRGAVAPTIAAVAVTVPSRCSSAVVVTLPSCSCGRPPRVHASRSTALPRRPCRSPLASCLVDGVVRVVVNVVGGGCRVYAPWAVLVSLLGCPRLCAPLGVIVGIIDGVVVGVLIAGGATSSSMASSIINANAASSTPVRQAAFVARGHTSALWCLPHPRAFAAEAAASLLVAAALAASGRRPALTLASTVHWAAIVPVGGGGGARQSPCRHEVLGRADAVSALWALSATLSRPGGPNTAAELNGSSRWALLDVREAGKNWQRLRPVRFSPEVFLWSIQSMLGGPATNRQRFRSVLLTP